MKHSHQQFSIRFVRIALAAVLAITFVGVSAQEKKPGKVQQGLVADTVVSAENQQQYGLVTLSTGCSGSLVRDNWVITAAHCVDDPDPKNRGQFIQVPENSVTVTAVWAGKQMRQSERIIRFRPNDVAIIRIASRFSGMNAGYNRSVYRDKLTPLSITVFGRGINQFATGSGATAMPSQTDGQYRVGYFKTDKEGDGVYSYPSAGAEMVAGGDSGGPSYVNGASGPLLVGVHSACDQPTCVPGKTCGTWTMSTPAPANYRPWQWAASTSRCGDASIAQVWDEIDRYLGAFVAPAQFIGTFGKTPPNYQPMWVYAIKNDGDLLWYRKDSGESPWQGPRRAGSGWNDFKDVIPAGGNSVYALTDDGNLFWYQHNGFNDGARDWKARVNVGHGWRFSKIFSGGEGIIYAIKEDGELLWYRHNGYADGGGPETWIGPKSVGKQWNGFKDVFSNGGGDVYAVTPNGELVYYHQPGYATGERRWLEARTLATGWQNFRQIIPAGGGVILTIKEDGKLLWFRHYFQSTAPSRLGRVKEHWEGPVEIGSGWLGFKKVIALLPAASAPVVR